MRKVLIGYQDVKLKNAKRTAGQTASSVITVSVDEKPSVQAVGNTAPDLTPVPSKHPQYRPRSRVREAGHLFDAGSVGSPRRPHHRARGGPSPQCRIHRPAVRSRRQDFSDHTGKRSFSSTAGPTPSRGPIPAWARSSPARTGAGGRPRRSTPLPAPVSPKPL